MSTVNRNEIVLCSSISFSGIHHPPLEDARWKEAGTQHETGGAKAFRIKMAEKRRIRRLCGWNVFQREQTQQRSLRPDEYKLQVKSIANRWRSLPEEDKAAYSVQAAHEAVLRDDLHHKPLPSKAETLASIAHDEPLAEVGIKAQLGRAFAKKVSARRLQENRWQRDHHLVWSNLTQLGDSALAMTHIEKWLAKSY